MNKKSKFLPIYSFPLLLSLVTSVSFATNYKINNYDLINQRNINDINNILKTHSFTNFNNVEIDYTSSKEKIAFTNGDDFLLEIKNILKNNEKKYNDFISSYYQINKIDLKNLKVGYRYSDKYYNDFYPTPRVFGQFYLNNQDRFYEKQSNDITKGYFKSLDSEPINNIQHPNYAFQIYTKYENDKKWIWEDENILNINLELTNFLKHNQYDPKKDLYLWFLQDNLKIENVPNGSTNISDYYQENIVVDKTSSISLLSISQDANLYCTNMIPFNAEIRNENNEIEKEWIEYRYFYSKVKNDANKNLITTNNTILKPQSPIEESLDSFKEGIAFFVKLSPDTLVETKSKNQYKLSDFLTKNFLIEYQKHFKDVLLEQEKDITFFTNYDSQLKNNIFKIEPSNTNIFFEDKDYSLKNQILDLFTASSEIDIANFIEIIFSKEGTKNRISFDFSTAFKNLIIGLKEAIDNNVSLDQVINSQWYIESKKEFNFYLDNNNFDYVYHFLSLVKDFFSEDIYINYANENIKIWDSKSFSFISFNIKENQNTINKMYKNSNSNLNLINKLKIEDNSKFNISNGNLVILNNNNNNDNNNSAPTLKNISEANVTFENNKNSFEYTGDPIKPSIELKTSDNKLIENQNYTLEYLNNTNVGQATILIKGQNNYTGQKEVTFNITKATNSIEVKYDKNQNISEIKSSFGKIEFFYFSDQECKNQLDKKPTNPGTYYLKAVVAETENYKQSEKVIEFKIEKQNNIPLIIGLSVGTLLGIVIIVGLILFIHKTKN
ncbi:MAG: hypothetical protein IKF44_01195 [Mycoplasmataceae bacterium]|nr:hypothetical protein [Mycoplasmataceae bacterium]